MKSNHRISKKQRIKPNPFKAVLTSGIPQNDEGKNGDFTVRKVHHNRVFLYYKFNNIESGFEALRNYIDEI